MKRRKIFWGIFFILAAVFVIVSRIWVLPEVSVFSILMTIFLIWVLAEGIRHINFYEILFSIALIAIIYDDQLGITELTPWTVLVAALLGSIGLSMIFREKRSNWNKRVDWEGSGGYSGASSEQCSGEQIRCENNFGSAIRYINSDNFRNAQLENNFGTMSIYFDNAVIQDGSAYVNVENNFGETNLYIPKEWKVQNTLDRSFGHISEKGRPVGSSNTVLYINGSANFGAINIYYV